MREKNRQALAKKILLFKQMGTAESKGNHRYRSNKHFRYKSETPIIHKCQHKNKQFETLTVGHKNSTKRKDKTIGK